MRDADPIKYTGTDWQQLNGCADVSGLVCSIVDTNYMFSILYVITANC